MRYQLELKLRRVEGAIVRILGTTERRGFQPVHLEGGAHADANHWHLRLTVEGEREPEGLQHQLEKLHDCLSVTVQPCT